MQGAFIIVYFLVIVFFLYKVEHFPYLVISKHDFTHEIMLKFY